MESMSSICDTSSPGMYAIKLCMWSPKVENGLPWLRIAALILLIVSCSLLTVLILSAMHRGQSRWTLILSIAQCFASFRRAAWILLIASCSLLTVLVMTVLVLSAMYRGQDRLTMILLIAKNILLIALPAFRDRTTKKKIVSTWCR